jgi:hypothetical protein
MKVGLRGCVRCAPHGCGPHSVQATHLVSLLPREFFSGASPKLRAFIAPSCFVLLAPSNTNPVDCRDACAAASQKLDVFLKLPEARPPVSVLGAV